MSYFLWVEDFENSVKVTATEVLGGIVTNEQLFSNKKEQLKRDLKPHGIYIELSFQDGLGFIRQNLNQIDYIILDIDLAAYSGDKINADVLELLEIFQDYKESADEIEEEQLLNEECAKLKALAGYYLYTELVVELGFPKQHILFCSNHGENSVSTREAFKAAKIALPTIYEKSAPEVLEWVKTRHENPYSRLRRGIIEGCKYLKDLPEESYRFKDFIEPEKQVAPEDMSDYLSVLENFLPLREPSTADKSVLYKLFIRTLTHEWEATDPKKIRGLAWIMKSTRNWITHNSTLFNALDETMLAYLFMINMRLMFGFDEAVQSYEKILLSLFEKDDLPLLIMDAFKDQIKNKLIAFKTPYLTLRNITLDENNRIATENKKNNASKKSFIKDAIYFNEIANNLQQSESNLRNDKDLFMKLLYQMLWLNTSSPIVGTGKKRDTLEITFKDYDYAQKPYLFELARHIYSRSFS